MLLEPRLQAAPAILRLVLAVARSIVRMKGMRRLVIDMDCRRLAGRIGGAGKRLAHLVDGFDRDALIDSAIKPEHWRVQLAGNVDIAGKVSLGISDTSSRKLGNSSLGYLADLASGKALNVIDNTDLSDAQKVVEEAIRQVSSARGRLGAFQKNTVGATIRNLGVAFENTAAAESQIRDADFASETAALTRGQILASASTNVLALANQQPQSALQLLG